MVICPRCQQPVDETVRTTCPLCATSIVGATAPVAPGVMPLNGPAPQPGVMPLNGPAPQPGVMPLNGPEPQPVAMPTPGRAPTGSLTPGGLPTGSLNPADLGPGLGANQRMTLTGEVIEVPPPSTSAAQVGNSKYQVRAYGSAPSKPEPVKAKTDPNAIIIPIVVVLVLALLGYGGWNYYMNRTDPKAQATKFFASLKEGNYKGIYATLETDPDKYKDEKDFVSQMEDANTALDPKKRALRDSLISGMEFQTAPAKNIAGGEATVPVTIKGKVTFMLYGMPQLQEIDKTVDLKMKNFMGIWKITRDNSFLQQATSMGVEIPGA